MAVKRENDTDCYTSNKRVRRIYSQFPLNLFRIGKMLVLIGLSCNFVLFSKVHRSFPEAIDHKKWPMKSVPAAILESTQRIWNATSVNDPCAPIVKWIVSTVVAHFALSARYAPISPTTIIMRLSVFLAKMLSNDIFTKKTTQFL